MTTVGAIGEDIGEIWAKKMLGGGFTSAQKVKDAWFSAGRGQYRYPTNLTGTITFRAFGWEDCMDDKLSSYEPTRKSVTVGGSTHPKARKSMK